MGGHGNSASVVFYICDILSFEKVWTIPKTKNGDSLVLPLMDEAIEVLQKRKEKSGWDNSPYVFSGKGGVGHLKETWKVWCRILERAGIVNLRIHDLRRTFGSWQPQQRGEQRDREALCAKQGVTCVILHISTNLKGVSSMKLHRDLK